MSAPHCSALIALVPESVSRSMIVFMALRTLAQPRSHGAGGPARLRPSRILSACDRATTGTCCWRRPSVTPGAQPLTLATDRCAVAATFLPPHPKTVLALPPLPGQDG